MIKNSNIPTIDTAHIENKRVLIREDFDVSLNPNHTIANDVRIQKSLPTISLLLKGKNTLILMGHLGRPEKRDSAFSLAPVVKDLAHLLPHVKVSLVEDFLSAKGKEQLTKQQHDEILVLENLRFSEGEEKNDPELAKSLASLADVYINDAFADSHRSHASIVGVPQHLPSYAGITLTDEVEAITSAIKSEKKPVVAIMGGAKIPDKLAFVSKLIEVADYLLVGGGIANTMLYAKGMSIGKSICEKEEKSHVEKLFALAKQHKTEIVLPADVVGLEGQSKEEKVVAVTDVPKDFSIFDIGPETQAIFGNIIAKANTILWNGPVGYFEKDEFRRGTDFLYYAITQNDHAYSLVGGGDTLAAISKKEYLDKISHISTGGGAMLELIEKGTLPGLEALKKK